MADDDPTFESTESGASHTYPQQAGEIRKGSHLMIKGHPCKCAEATTSKTGAEGLLKTHIVAIDIFTSKKLEDICPSTHNMDVPNVKRKDYQLIGMDDDFVSLMDDSGETRDDLKCPESGEVGDAIRAAIDNEQDILCTVLSACGEECIIATKINTAVDK